MTLIFLPSYVHFYETAHIGFPDNFT